jgi:protein-L-isoaspartate(D-aspartate) O-methyltransferase
MTDFAAARRKMVENQLRTNGITDRRLIAVMAQLPREDFVPAARRDLAYIDGVHQLPGSSGRSLAAPAPFARMVQLAEVESTSKVLDIGCGTGYSAAVLASLADSVVAVESDAELAAEARRHLAELGLDDATVVEGPLEAGAPSEAPFDVIILEGAVREVPKTLFGQLAEGGRLVALLQEGAAAAAHLYVRSGDDVAGRPEFNTTLPPLGISTPNSEFVF